MLFKKKKEQEEVLQQDLSKEVRPGSVFIMQLLMKEMCPMPDKEQMIQILDRHLEGANCFGYSENVACFEATKYLAEFSDGSMPPHVNVMGCAASNMDSIGMLERSQMWDCLEDRDRILAECKYQVVATDMLAAGLPAKQRAEMLMNFMEALVELYPQCEAVYFQNSGKLFWADAIRHHHIPKEGRFVYFAVNVRFFNIQGTEDMMVDTLGMSTLFLPDLQYHFHGMDHNRVINHAYNMALYLFQNDNPLEDGDTIDAISENGNENSGFARDIQWKCHYENALIQPARVVIDVCMNQYASGNRS